MKNISLKEIHLVNFKGVRKFDCAFNERLTTISGKNGLGKSTIADAFVWLLFGKNTDDAKVFSIKTLDESGNAIPKLPHEVSATITVDSQEITLTRRYEEKWTKHRGSAEEVFEGNKESYLFNEVPCSKKEYEAKVAEICDETVFKLITSPRYFTSLPWKDQRTILFDMAGGVTDEELANGNTDFANLLNALTGKSLDEYKREVSAKKKRIKNEIDSIPARIDEINRNIPESHDWNSIQAEAKGHEERIKEIDGILTDLSKAQTSIAEERKGLINRLSDVRLSITSRRNTIKSELNQNYYDMAAKRQEINREVADIEYHTAKHIETIRIAKANIERAKNKRIGLSDLFAQTQGEQLSISDNEFECPCCHRPYSLDKIDEIKEQRIKDFNEKKAAKLKEINSEAKANKETLTANESVVAEREADIRLLNDKVKTLRSHEAFSVENMRTVDATPAINADKEIKTLLAEEKKLQEQIDAPISTNDEEMRLELRSEKADLQDMTRNLYATLATRGIIEQNKARIDELESELKTQSQALADLERIEFTIQEFTMARINAMTDKVNGMFGMVKFNLFKEQLNGGVAECCEATVNGVPYPDINSAHKILAGLDIISTICRHKDVCAPCVVDNAETINQLPDIGSQMIALRVSEDNTLTIS